MLLEIIATCVDDAIIAEQNGADRLELITAITEGGLTPGIGLVEEVVKTVSIPVHVMVRPHSRSFQYNKHDIATMIAEVKAIRQTGAAGVVLGMLTADGKIDEAALQEVLQWTGEMQVTFHRAFDELEDQFEGLAVLQKYPAVTRILTSGGPQPAPQAMPHIRQLVEQSRNSGIQILAGNGLKWEIIQEFIQQTGVAEVHFGSAVRYGRSGLKPIDPIELRSLADSIHH
ncbi:copper homeostasis protein CutC [Paenibacillus sp. JCM 10914]|uniref:copper homeostasis protein CutC n=1 Tax=Paenibacillus sp. JCM 10914 TaxID=1236974 RepID=UPI0003CC3B39|nr:copper homeostasis protein CutC [Paenibacillus sp. JCM 10914]GAE05029.1 cytoplasmic copper homeostasis protein cutC [Paenibacillus sp. JCM 10914]